MLHREGGVHCGLDTLVTCLLWLAVAVSRLWSMYLEFVLSHDDSSLSLLLKVLDQLYLVSRSFANLQRPFPVSQLLHQISLKESKTHPQPLLSHPPPTTLYNSKYPSFHFNPLPSVGRVG